MAILENSTGRAYNLPAKTNAHGESYGANKTLAPGGKLEVPDWYPDALREEKGWAARLDRRNVVGGPRMGGMLDDTGRSDVAREKMRVELKQMQSALSIARAEAAETRVDLARTRAKLDDSEEYLKRVQAERVAAAEEIKALREQLGDAEARAVKLRDELSQQSRRANEAEEQRAAKVRAELDAASRKGTTPADAPEAETTTPPRTGGGGRGGGGR